MAFTSIDFYSTKLKALGAYNALPNQDGFILLALDTDVQIQGDGDVAAVPTTAVAPCYVLIATDATQLHN